MLSVLNFTPNWNKWYHAPRYRNGFRLFEELRFRLWLARR